MNDDKIIQTLCCEETGYHTTNDPLDAIYILRNGIMVSGGAAENYGSRTIDHNCMGWVLKSNPYINNHFYRDVFETLEVVMVIPESKTIAYPKGMKITESQRRVMNFLETKGYEIEESEYN